MIELKPEIIKLDRYLTINLAQSKVKQRVVEMFVHYCQEDVLLILEGIENQEELEIAKQLGVHAGQGFYWGRPDTLMGKNARATDEYIYAD